MHYLLIPYVLLSLAFIMQFHLRRDAVVKAGLVFTAGVTLVLMFFAITLRPVDGDSWRYYEYFQLLHIRGLDWAFASRDQEPLWAALNGFVSLFGDQAWLLFGATLLIYLGVFVLAVKRITGPVATTIVIMCYAAFPFFVAYAASGLRQGLALVFLLMAYADFKENKRTAWAWLLLAPLWHSGSWLACGVMVAHWAICRWLLQPHMRWRLVFLALATAIGLSVTGLNESLIGGYAGALGLAEERYIYFSSADVYGYRAGFRLDFFVFSLLPLVSAWVLRGKARTFDYTGAGWWLSLYLSLNVLYHLFSFAPFADRFAAYSWFLMPLVVFLQVRETHNRTLMTLFVSAVCLIDVVMLQLYTGNFIREPGWWG